MADEIVDQGVDTEVTGAGDLGVEIGELIGLEVEPSVTESVVEPVVEPTVVEPVTKIDPVVEPVVEPTTPVVETPPSEIDQLKSQNENLLKLIGELSEKVNKGVVTPTEVIPGETVSLDKLMEDFDFDEIMESKVKFTEFIKGVVNATKVATLQEMSGVVPQYVAPHVQQQLSLQELHREFYETHKELSGLKSYVSQIAKEYATANPDKTVQEVLNETAKIAKTNLGLPLEPIVTPSTTSNTKPVLPGGTRSTKTSKGGSSDSLAGEIAELIDL